MISMSIDAQSMLSEYDSPSRSEKSSRIEKRFLVEMCVLFFLRSVSSMSQISLTMRVDQSSIIGISPKDCIDAIVTGDARLLFSYSIKNGLSIHSTSRKCSMNDRSSP